MFYFIVHYLQISQLHKKIIKNSAYPISIFSFLDESRFCKTAHLKIRKEIIKAGSCLRG